MLKEDGSRSSHRPQSSQQRPEQFNVICEQPTAQEIRSDGATRTTLATITPIEYHGNVWCVQVPTGAFVARRNGHIFITGNSGFPKSMDISKAIDKKFGVEREIIGQREDILKKQAKDLREGKRKIVDSLNAGANERNNGFVTVSADITTPTTDEAKQWDGWGTALKPANEPIVVARKPLSEKTVADNVLKWGTGGLNIDGCRIESGGEHKRAYQPTNHERGVYGKQTAFQPSNKEGRFPANVIFDEEAGKLLDEQSGITKSGGTRPNGKNNSELSWKNTSKEIIANNYIPPNSGGASRFFFNVEQDDLEDLIPFFYCAKASKKERGEGNIHPTVKPLKLISYLITLVTPPNGICLDIFEGSGTHALACIENGFKYIGFELEKKYYDIATERIENHKQQLTLF